MGNNGFLKINEFDLNELFDFKAKSLVGKVCKRFEIIEDKEIIKRELKELVYEEYRTLKELLIATGYGLGITQFNFKGKNQST